jgi:histidyl-tRNA synthetase
MNTSSTTTKVLVIPVDGSIDYSISILNKLREYDIKSEIYLEDVKMNKKLSYADKLEIPYAVLIGGEEVKKQRVTLKNLNSGEQSVLTIDELIKKVSAENIL